MTKSVDSACGRVGLSGALVLSVLAGGLGGCSAQNASPEVAPLRPQAFESVAPWFSGDRPVSQTLLLATDTRTERPRLIGTQRFEAQPVLPEAETQTIVNGGEVMRVTLATNGAPADEVIRTIVAEMLGMSYAIDPTIVNAKAVVTLDVDEEMTRSGVMRMLGGLAEVYGWVIEDRGDLLFFRAAGTGAQGKSVMSGSSATPILRAEAAMGGQTPVVRVRTMRSMTAANASSAIKDLLSPAGSVVVSGQHLLIVDTIDQTRRAEAVLAALDVPAFDGVEIQTYRLAHRASADAVSMLKDVAEASGVTGGDRPAAAFLAVPGTSDVMVIARDPSVLPAVRDLVELVDRPAGDTRRGTYLYRIQHYDPAQLVRLLTEFMGDRIEAPVVGAAQASRGQGGDSGQKIRIAHDINEEILLIRATAEDYAELLGLISSIDRPRQQVVLSAIIAEVTLEDRLEFGVDYFLNALDDDGTVLDLFGTPGVVASPTGTVSLVGGSGQVVIQALRSESDVDILSQPRVVVRDGATANFQVGGDTPVVLGDVNSDLTDDSTTAIRRQIDYRNTGVILNVSTKINESGDVRLEIQQTIEEVSQQTELGPEFTTRELQTEVIVPHGQTLLLAGMIENTVRQTTRRVPVLGELPIVGVAFQNIEDVEERRELVLAITPTIISSPQQASGTLGDFLDAAEGVQSALHGNADRLQRGVLNSDALQAPLGGFGEEPGTPGDAAEESPMRQLREQLRMQSKREWDFGPGVRSASFESDER